MEVWMSQAFAALRGLVASGWYGDSEEGLRALGKTARYPSDGWVFVVGLPRSGTSLLGHLLSLHQSCCCTNEASIVPTLLSSVRPPGKPLVHGWYSATWHTGDGDVLLPWQLPNVIDALRGRSAIASEVRDGSVACAMARLLCETIRDLFPRVSLFGDKNPSYCSLWPMLRPVFPGCKIVKILRPIEECVESLLWLRWVTDEASAWGTLRQMQDALDLLEPTITVDLNALAAEPDEVIRRLLPELGLDPATYPSDDAVAVVNGGGINRRSEAIRRPMMEEQVAPPPPPHQAAMWSLLHDQSSLGLYRYGMFQPIDDINWGKAVLRLDGVQQYLRTRHISVMLDEEIRWLLPLFFLLEHDRIDTIPCVDVGCGASTTMWDFWMRGESDLCGIDMWPQPLPDGVRFVQSLVEDIGTMRRAIASIELSTGGIMVCTEMLEHMRWNPVPSFVMLVEHFKPEYIYFTAPTFTSQFSFMRKDWVHYSELPLFRGEGGGGRVPPWHYKPWTYDEMADLGADLGFSSLGGFAGFTRCGYAGRRASE